MCRTSLDSIVGHFSLWFFVVVLRCRNSHIPNCCRLDQHCNFSERSTGDCGLNTEGSLHQVRVYPVSCQTKKCHFGALGIPVGAHCCLGSSCSVVTWWQREWKIWSKWMACHSFSYKTDICFYFKVYFDGLGGEIKKCDFWVITAL